MEHWSIEDYKNFTNNKIIKYIKKLHPLNPSQDLHMDAISCMLGGTMTEKRKTPWKLFFLLLLFV